MKLAELLREAAELIATECGKFEIPLAHKLEKAANHVDIRECELHFTGYLSPDGAPLVRCLTHKSFAEEPATVCPVAAAVTLED